MDYCERLKREHINLSSVTNAIGWSGIFNGFAKEGTKKMELFDILPFPELARPNQSRLSPATEKILKRLLEQEKIPFRIAAVLSMVNEVK